MTVQVQLRLGISFADDSMKDYWGARDTDAETAAIQEMQDYLYRAMHGWGGDTAATQFANLESTSWQMTLDAADGTELPEYSEVLAAVNAGVEAYNTLGYGLGFNTVATTDAPTTIKYEREGKMLRVRYDFDLSCSSYTQSSSQCNRLPIDFADDVPSELQVMKVEKLTAHYRLSVLVERNPRS